MPELFLLAARARALALDTGDRAASAEDACGVWSPTAAGLGGDVVGCDAVAVGSGGGLLPRSLSVFDEQAYGADDVLWCDLEEGADV